MNAAAAPSRASAPPPAATEPEPLFGDGGAKTPAEAWGSDLIVLPMYAWLAMVAAIGKTTKLKRQFSMVPTSAPSGGDRYSFGFNRHNLTVVMRYTKGAGSTSELTGELEHAERKAGDARAAQERCRTSLENFQNLLAKAEARGQQAEAGPGATDAELELLRMSVATATTEHSKAGEAVTEAQLTVDLLRASLAQVHTETTVIPLADIERGRVLPFFPRKPRKEEA